MCHVIPMSSGGRAKSAVIARAEREVVVTESLDYLTAHSDDLLADLERFVTRETPSTDPSALAGFAAFLATYATTIADGMAALVPASGGPHVRVVWGDPERAAPILLLGHFDTVWDVGTLATMPFRVASGAAYGPGTFDMKAGLVQGFWAVRAYREALGGDRPVVFFCNSDEEIGSASSRPHFEADARRAAAVLVLEPSHHGALKTARKGTGEFHLAVRGRASHAGTAPEDGISAIDELARQILDLRALADAHLAHGTTINVGTVSGGTRTNVVAAEARADIDVRVATLAEADHITAAITGLRAHHPEARLEIAGGVNRPPMERTLGTVRLFERARALAANLGFAVDEVMVGGGSDGNFCSALGVPVLDGLGAVGDGAHALDEHIIVAEMPQRAALVASLLAALGDDL
jgi:glutamate carboxypeptidase